MAGFTHYGGARVVVFVHAVAKAHQAERVILIFRTTNKFRNVLNGADFFQHFQRRFVGAAVRRSPQGGDTGSDTGERVRARRACGTYGGGGRVLFVVRVQDQDTVHGAFQYRVNLVGFARRGEHHIQEVTRVGEVIARVNERLTDRILVAHRGHGRHFRQQTVGGDFTVARVIHVQRVMVERRQRAGNTAHHRHRVRVAAERVEQTGNLFMDHGVAGNGGFEFVVLLLGRFFAVQQDVAHFKII